MFNTDSVYEIAGFVEKFLNIENPDHTIYRVLSIGLADNDASVLRVTVGSCLCCRAGEENYKVEVAADDRSARIIAGRIANAVKAEREVRSRAARADLRADYRDELRALADRAKVPFIIVRGEVAGVPVAVEREAGDLVVFEVAGEWARLERASMLIEKAAARA